VRRVKRVLGWLIVASVLPAITTAFGLTKGAPAMEILIAIAVVHCAFAALFGMVCLVIWLLISD
jgi:hypothetical protein